MLTLWNMLNVAKWQSGKVATRARAGVKPCLNIAAPEPHRPKVKVASILMLLLAIAEK